MNDKQPHRSDPSPAEVAIRLSQEEQQLFALACEGRLDETSHQALQDLLRQSPQARTKYLDYSAMHADLKGLVRTQRIRERVNALIDAELAKKNVVDRSAQQQPAGQLTPIGSAMTTRTQNNGRVWGGYRASTAFFALAASLLLVLTLYRPGAEQALTETGLANADQSQVESIAPESKEVANQRDKRLRNVSWPGLVATIKRTEQVTWSKRAIRFEELDLITAGEEIRLDSGLVEIEFRQGAVVVLEGPAHLVADDANAATLLSGQLAAVAPPWATGFRIDTPGVDVIDHGTEFTVSVDPDAETPKVDVRVTEGEVEIVDVDKEHNGRRLKAGQGVRANGKAVEERNELHEERQHCLTEQLPNRPEFKNTEVIADWWRDRPMGETGLPATESPWRFYANLYEPFGNPKHYLEMVWHSNARAFRPKGKDASEWLRAHIRSHMEGGHPGRGSTQTDNGIDCYSITAYTIPKDGVYRIEAGWLERLWAKRWDRDRVLDIAVHVNNGPLLIHEFCNRDCFVTFSGSLGMLSEGDVVYLGVGPNGVDYNDRYRWGFSIVCEVDNTKDLAILSQPSSRQ